MAYTSRGIVEIYRAVSRVLKKVDQLPSAAALRNLCKTLNFKGVEVDAESTAAVVSLLAALEIWKERGLTSRSGEVDPRRLSSLEATFKETVAYFVRRGLPRGAPDKSKLRREVAYLLFVEEALKSLESCCGECEQSALERGCQVVLDGAGVWEGGDGVTEEEGGAADRRHPLLLEFGVYRGKSIRVIARAALALSGRSRVIGFDSFAGLPSAWRPGFPAGAFGISEVEAVSTISALEREFPGVLELRRGLFKDSLPPFLHEEFGFKGVNGEVASGCGDRAGASTVAAGEMSVVKSATAAAGTSAAATAAATAETATAATTIAAGMAASRARLVLVHVDCDIYKSTSTVLNLLCSAKAVESGLVLVFDELVNFDVFLAHEMRALFEFVERLNSNSCQRYRLEWIGGRRGDMSRACRLVGLV